MNANGLHRWLKERCPGQPQITCDTANAVACNIVAFRDDAVVQPVASRSVLQRIRRMPAPYPRSSR